MSCRYGTYIVKELPPGYFRLTLESLEKMEKEADELLEKLNYVQACEKYYKILEEVVKMLGVRFSPNTMNKVGERLRKGATPWTTHLLNVAVDEIIENIGWKDTELERIFRNGWRASVTLHREVFHEFELTERDILNEVRKVKDAFALAKSALRNCEEGFLRTTSTTDREVESSLAFLRKLRIKGESTVSNFLSSCTSIRIDEDVFREAKEWA